MWKSGRKIFAELYTRRELLRLSLQQINTRRNVSVIGLVTRTIAFTEVGKRSFFLLMGADFALQRYFCFNKACYGKVSFWGNVRKSEISRCLEFLKKALCLKYFLLCLY